MICCRLEYFSVTFDCEPATQLNIVVVLGRVGGEEVKKKGRGEEKKKSNLTIQAGGNAQWWAGADNRHE